MSEIGSLVEEYKEIINSERNKKNKDYWEVNFHPWYGEMWRGVPRKNFKKVPLIINPEKQMWSDILNIDLIEYYTDPNEWLKQELRMRLYRFKNWKDNYYNEKYFYIWFACVTEISFFGPEVIFFKNRSPWLGSSKPLLENKKYLAKMKYPDFYKSGLMPRVHKYYETIGEKLNGYLRIVFPDWTRGPFGIAVLLRGMENILMDMITDSKFVHKLMRYVVDSQKNWLEERAKFLKNKYHPISLFANDDVGAPMISPDLYNEFILPYEIEISEFKGGIAYWHSCNNTTDFYELIKKIPNLKLMHISPWADDKKAAEVFKDEIPLDRCLHPYKDVLGATKEEMGKKIRQIVDNFGDIPRYFINFNGIERVHELEHDLNKIKEFVSIYNNIMEEKQEGKDY